MIAGLHPGQPSFDRVGRNHSGTATSAGQFSAMLPAGDHAITLTATDSDGNKGTASR